MPIYRYDDNGYSNNGTPEWRVVKNIYRFNDSITNKWQALKTIWRYDANGYSNDGIPEWRRIFRGTTPPEISTAPRLRNQVSSYDNFYGGDVLTLTRGAYTNTSADSDTTYRMTIYRSINLGTGIGLNTWDPVSRTTFTGSNSTASTTITYTITDQDAKDGYYFAAEVSVNPDANIAGSTLYDFETVIPPSGIQRILSRVSFTVTGLTTLGVTDNDVTLSWTVNGITDSSFISSHTVKIKNGTVNGTDAISPITGISASARVYQITDNTSLQPNQNYVAIIEAIGNDGWKTSGSQTIQSDNEPFTTTSVLPINTVAPSVTPLNGRSYSPRNTQLTCSTGTWSNVNASTVYSYQWQYYDQAGVGESGYLNMSEPGNNTNTFVIPNTSLYASKIRCKVTARNGTDTPVSAFATWGDTAINVDPQVSINTLSPLSFTPGVSSTYNFSISGYPTQYTINWGDATTPETYFGFFNETIFQNRAHTYSTSGSKTVTITTQPGNVQRSFVLLGPYSFAFNNILFVGTNGYISFDQASTSTAISAVPFRSLGIYPTNLIQGQPTADVIGLKYWSNSSDYVLQWRGYYFNQISQSAYALDYQVKFNKDNAYADVSIIRKGSLLPVPNMPGVYTNGFQWISGTNGLPAYSIPTDTVDEGDTANAYTYRLNFNGTQGTLNVTPWPDRPIGKRLRIPDSLMISAQQINTSNNLLETTGGGVDNGWTRIQALPQQYIPCSMTSGVVTATSTSLSIPFNFVGPEFATYSYTLRTGSYSGTIVSSANTITTNPLVITGLQPSTRYYLTTIPLSVMSQEGVTLNNFYDTTAALSKLATPTNVAASDNRSDGINITWTAVANAAYYGIWYGGAPSYDSTPDFGGPNNPTLITGTSYLDASMGSGVTRDYYVQAFRTNNPLNTKSDWSLGDFGTRVAPVVLPGTPTSLTATTNRSDGVSLAFSGSTNATSYDIYWNILGASRPASTVTPDFPGVSSPYLDTGIPPSSSRQYWVRGKNAGGTSEWFPVAAGASGIVGTRTSAGSAPATPTNVSTSGSGLVTWTASSGATSYTVEYQLASSASGTLTRPAVTQNVTSPTTSYQIAYETVGGTTYNYARARVLATNANGDSPYSAYSPPTGYV